MRLHSNRHIVLRKSTNHPRLMRLCKHLRTEMSIVINGRVGTRQSQIHLKPHQRPETLAGHVFEDRPLRRPYGPSSAT
jgi:hypothetical protein